MKSMLAVLPMVILSACGQPESDSAVPEAPAPLAPTAASPAPAAPEIPVSAPPPAAVESAPTEAAPMPAIPATSPAAPAQATPAATAAPASPQADSPAPADPAAGRQTYQQACAFCHDKGVAGAPRMGDAAAWSARTAQGRETLYASALKGKGAMPARGGNPALSDDAVRAAVDYLVAGSR